MYNVERCVQESRMQHEWLPRPLLHAPCSAGRCPYVFSLFRAESTKQGLYASCAGKYKARLYASCAWAHTYPAAHIPHAATHAAAKQRACCNTASRTHKQDWHSQRKGHREPAVGKCLQVWYASDPSPESVDCARPAQPCMAPPAHGRGRPAASSCHYIPATPL